MSLLPPRLPLQMQSSVIRACVSVCVQASSLCIFMTRKGMARPVGARCAGGRVSPALSHQPSWACRAAHASIDVPPTLGGGSGASIFRMYAASLSALGVIELTIVPWEVLDSCSVEKTVIHRRRAEQVPYAVAQDISEWRAPPF